jgi:hypothetical protein
MAGGDNSSRSGERMGDLARAKRLRAALRENLKRRKAQAKRRANDRASGPGHAAPHDSAGIVPDKSET